MLLEHRPSDSKYLALYHTSKRLFWDPALVDLSQDRASWERIRRDHERERYIEQLLLLLALFNAGEESVTRTLSPFLSGVARAGLGVDKEMFLASQLYEEAKHFEFFARYGVEVLDARDAIPPIDAEPYAVLVNDLESAAERIRRAERNADLVEALVAGVTHYMGVVEAMLARTGYRGVGEALGARGWLPGLQEGFTLIRRDEGRHVAFGIHFVREMVARDPSLADLVRDTFERQLPNVLATVAMFDYEHPIAPVEPLQRYALDAYGQFMSAAGLTTDPELAEALERELSEA